MAETAAVVERLAESDEPAYGVSTGFGSLAQTRIPPERRDGAAAGADPLARRRDGRPGRARGGAGDDVPARPLAGDGLLGRAAGARRDDAGAAQRRAHPVVPEHGSLGASGDLAPLAHCALALIGEGEVLGLERRAAPGGATRSPRPASSRPSLGAKEGLALINGTDGILGMLVLALADLADAAAGRRRHGGDVSSRRCSEPTAPSPPTSSRCARSPGRRSAPPTCARLLDRLGDRRQPPRGRPPRPGRLLAALHAAGPRRRARHSRPRRVGGRGRARRRDRQPDGAPRRPGRVVRQLPRRPGRLRLRLPRDRRRRGRRDRRAAHRPPARRLALARAAAVPRPGRRASTRG